MATRRAVVQPTSSAQSVARHSNDTELVTNLRNLADRECAFACAEEVFPCLCGIAFRSKFGTVGANSAGVRVAKR